MLMLLMMMPAIARPRPSCWRSLIWFSATMPQIRPAIEQTNARISEAIASPLVPPTGCGYPP
jgi:hypothetical protein